MTHIDGNLIYLDEFDETLDNIMIDVVRLFKDKIAEAAELDNTPVIEFWINSLGGDSHKAFALVGLMEWAKASGVQVNTVVLSEAASSGSIVACAGSVGHRLTNTTALWLMHYGSVEITATSPIDLQRQFHTYETHFTHIANHYTDNSKYDYEFWQSALVTDNYTVTGIDAVSIGLADGFLGG